MPDCFASTSNRKMSVNFAFLRSIPHPNENIREKKVAEKVSLTISLRSGNFFARLNESKRDALAQIIQIKLKKPFLNRSSFKSSIRCSLLFHCIN